MSFFEKIGAWLARDQIRIAPDAGRLLGLQPSQKIVLDGSLWVIAERHESSRPDQPGVRYLLAEYEEQLASTYRSDPPCVAVSASHFDIS